MPFIVCSVSISWIHECYKCITSVWVITEIEEKERKREKPRLKKIGLTESIKTISGHPYLPFVMQ